MSAKTILTLEQFLQLPEDDLFHELDEGELLTMSPTKRRRGEVQWKLSALLAKYLENNPVCSAYPAETGFLLDRDPPIVRSPDIALVRAGRPHLGEADEFIQGAPDLAIEVISPSDAASSLLRKVKQYLRAGCQAVWVVYPEEQEVHVHQSRGVRVLQRDQSLEAPELLPGFSVAVRTLFE